MAKRKKGTKHSKKPSITKYTGIPNEAATYRKKLKQSNKSLGEESRLNNLIIRAAPFGILVYNAKSGRCMFANDAACEIVGAPKARLLQQNFRKIKSWRSGLLGVAEDAITTGLLQKTEAYMTTTFGKEAYIEATFVPFPRNHKDFLMLIMKDVLEKKKLEDSLKEQVDELAAVNKMMVGRELKMVELKKEIEKLRKRVS